MEKISITELEKKYLVRIPGRITNNGYDPGLKTDMPQTIAAYKCLLCKKIGVNGLHFNMFPDEKHHKCSYLSKIGITHDMLK